MYKRILYNQRLQISLLLSLTFFIVLVYLPALTVPFYLDDSDAILGRLAQYLNNSLADLWLDNQRRSLSYSTLWMDARLYGNNAVGYHVTNIIIHVLTTIAVFLFSRKLCHGVAQQIPAGIFALGVAAVWGLHPLNSQAVIYVVQRMASLVSLFMVLSCWCWLNWRLSSTRHNKLWLFGALVSFILAWNSKENAVILPLVWLLIDLTLPNRSSFVWRAVIGSSILLVALFLPLTNLISPSLLTTLDSISRETTIFSRLEYFWVQQQVLFDYLGTWLWPANLMLFYPYYEGGTSSEQGLYLLFHLALISAAIFSRRRFPLIFLGILLFYAGHLLESSFVPIKDLAFEHRNYFPSVGLSIVSVAVVFYLIQLYKRPVGRLSALAGLVIICALGTKTYLRASEWQDPQQFHQSNFELAPNNPNAKLMYAIELAEAEDLKRAEKLLKEVIDYQQGVGQLNFIAADNYLRVIQAQGGYYASIAPAIKMLTKIESSKARSQLLTTLAQAYVELDGCPMAIGFLNRALTLDERNDRARGLKKRCEGKTDFNI